MNSIQNFNSIPFRGNIVIKDKSGNRILIPAKEVKYISEDSSGIMKGTYIVTNIDALGVDKCYRIKNIPYEQVVELYKKALDSNNDVEIPSY